MRKTLFSVLAVSLVVCLTDVTAWAALNLGPLDVSPQLKFTGVYDDNIFVQNGDEVDDYYFLITPRIGLALRQRDNLFELEYHADIFRYVDTGDVNDTEDHYIRGAAEINFPGGLSIKVDDLWSMRHEFRSESNLAISGVTPLNEYDSNELDVEVRYETSERFAAAVGYHNYLIDYDLTANSFRNRTDHGASATVYYRFMPKTAVLLQGRYTNVYHTDDNSTAAPRLNSNEYWALAGLTWDITEKSTGTVRIGYEWKDFDHPQSRDFDTAVYIVSLDHRFTPKTSLTLSGVRRAEETDDPAVSYYTTTGGRLGMRFNPVGKLEIMPFGSMTHNRYSGDVTAAGDTGRRQDNIVSAGLDIKYGMNKWLSIGAGYKYSKRSSNLTFYDYTDNTVSVSITGSI